MGYARQRHNESIAMARKQFRDAASQRIKLPSYNQKDCRKKVETTVKIKHFPEWTLYAAFYRELKSRGRWDPPAVAETLEWIQDGQARIDTTSWRGILPTVGSYTHTR